MLGSCIPIVGVWKRSTGGCCSSLVMPNHSYRRWRELFDPVREGGRGRLVGGFSMEGR